MKQKVNSHNVDDDMLKMVSIHVEKKHGQVTKVILTFLILVSILLPICFLILFQEKIGKSFFISIIVFWLVGFYFLRILLWDSFGVEEIELRKSSIMIFLNYKLFRLKQGIISTDSLTVSFLPTAVESKEKSEMCNRKNTILVFYSKSSDLKTTVPMTREMAFEMKVKIMDYIKK